MTKYCSPKLVINYRHHIDDQKNNDTKNVKEQSMKYIYILEQIICINSQS